MALTHAGHDPRAIGRAREENERLFFEYERGLTGDLLTRAADDPAERAHPHLTRGVADNGFTDVKLRQRDDAAAARELQPIAALFDGLRDDDGGGLRCQFFEGVRNGHRGVCRSR